jgi:hypothetical protein
MAKTEATMNPSSGYEQITVMVSEGRALLRYRVTGSKIDGRDAHDEDVTEWSDQDLRNLACDLLDVDRQFAGDIAVERD